jgi:hypothetical protein
LKSEQFSNLNKKEKAKKEKGRKTEKRRKKEKRKKKNKDCYGKKSKQTNIGQAQIRPGAVGVCGAGR